MKRDSAALKVRTKDFAFGVLRLYRAFPRTEEARILGTQLLAAAHPLAPIIGLLAGEGLGLNS